MIDVDLSKCETYVAFSDSGRDPTYSPADSVYLVAAECDEDTYNPCGDDNKGVRITTPLLPKNKMELELFAACMGWDLKFDAQGKAILHTGISDE